MRKIFVYIGIVLSVVAKGQGAFGSDGDLEPAGNYAIAKMENISGGVHVLQDTALLPTYLRDSAAVFQKKDSSLYRFQKNGGWKKIALGKSDAAILNLVKSNLDTTGTQDLQSVIGNGGVYNGNAIIQLITQDEVLWGASNIELSGNESIKIRSDERIEFQSDVRLYSNFVDGNNTPLTNGQTLISDGTKMEAAPIYTRTQTDSAITAEKQDLDSFLDQGSSAEITNNFTISNITSDVTFSLSSIGPILANLSVNSLSNRMLFKSDSLLFGESGSASYKGLFYENDYSANFSDRSIIDKSHVKDLINERTDVKLDSAFGFWDYDHSGTMQGYTANDTIKLENDGAGANTLTSYAPLSVADIYDTNNDSLVFSNFNLGATITIRVDLTVDFASNNSQTSVNLVLAAGTPNEYRLSVEDIYFKTSGVHQINDNVEFYIGNVLTRDNNAYVEFISDSNADVTVNGWYINVRNKTW